MLVYLKTPEPNIRWQSNMIPERKFLQGVDLDDGEGYISLNGKKNFVNVKEKKDCNLCIKAFTRD